MKNIHVLPNNCSISNLVVIGEELTLVRSNYYSKSYINLHGYKSKAMYITSDEEIKEGNWYYNHKINTIVRRTKGTDNESYIGFKKTILTTDQDLIKDGVQAIDDEFLEWFVNNPSCEYVEIKKDSYNLSPMEKMLEKEYVPKSTFDTYKIIIPKKEPKDVVLGYKTSLDAQMLDKIGLKEPKQIKCYCGHTTYCDCDSLEPEQETLDYLQVCEDCGSEEVARCKWVNVNTEEIYSADSGNNLEWCFNCKNETNIIDK
jgi:hypothetical protein